MKSKEEIKKVVENVNKVRGSAKELKEQLEKERKKQQK